MKKSYTKLKNLFGENIKTLCERFGIPRQTVVDLDAGKAGADMEIMTEWLIEAVEILNRTTRKTLIESIKPVGRRRGSKAATCIVLLNAVSLMRKEEAVIFIKKITTGRK